MLYLSGMNNIFLKWINIGLTNETSYLNHRQINAINLLSPVCFLFLSVSAVVNFANDPLEIRLIEAITSVLFLIPVYLNAKGFFFYAKLLIVLTALAFLFTTFIIMGPGSGNQFYFICLTAFCFLIFSFREWTLTLLLTFLMVGVSFAINYKYAEGSLTPAKEKAALEIDFESNLFISGLLFIIVMFYFNYIVTDTERLYTEQKKAYQKNEELIMEVINAYSSGVWVVDKEYRLIIFNKRYAEFCAAAFNGFKVYKGYHIDNSTDTGDPIANERIDRYNKEWLKYYDKAFEGKTSIRQFEVLTNGIPVQLEVTFAPFNVDGYASGAIMYSKRIMA